MPVTIKCPDCGHTEQSQDGASKTCPECDGTMAAPPKKKYQAKATSLEEEERARKKPKREEDRPRQKARPRDEEEEDEEEKPKAKTRPRDEDERPQKKVAKKELSLDDEDEDEDDGGYDRSDKIARRLGLDPGFKDKALMRQVEKALANGEVLHFACRPSEVIAKKQGLMAMLGGIFFSLIGAGVGVFFLKGAKGVPPFALIVPCIFVLFGIGMAILGPIMKNRQARLGWYAVTDRRALVFHISLWGQSGKLDVYHPSQLRNMWVKGSIWLKGGGDIVFKTIVTQTTRVERDRFGNTRRSTSTSTQHFGFLGIADVNEVEALLREVLLSRRRDDDDEDDDD